MKKQFIFSTSYRGDPKIAFDLLCEPHLLAKWVPNVRKVEVLGQPSHTETHLKWEVDIDGAILSWHEIRKCITDKQVVKFRMLKGDLKVYRGEWIIKNQGNQVHVSLIAEIDWGAPNLSQFIGDILTQKSEVALRGMVLGLGRAAQRKQTPNRDQVHRFGYIFHPLDQGLFADGFLDRDLKAKPRQLLERVMEWIPPFRRSIVTGLHSDGMKIEGDMILMPLLPEQLLTLDDKFVLTRLVEAGRLAERYGDKIVGLGAYAASIGHKGNYLAKNLHIPVTTGSSYTIAIVLEAIFNASGAIGLRMPDASVAIIGATGTIGQVCTHVMARESGYLMLVGRNQPRLNDLVQSLNGKARAVVSTHTELDAALTSADIIITATNTPSAIIDISKVKPGAIICDVSRPRNVAFQNAKQRPDVLVLDGGIVRPPGNVDFHFSFGLPPGLIYACMAEVMILALEKRYESYSLGGNVQVEKVSELAELGQKYGFKLAGLRSFDREISPQQLRKVYNARKLRGKRIPVSKKS